MTYRFANYAGRAVLVDGDSYHDLEQLSDGKVSSDPMKAIAMEDLLHELQTKAQGRLPSGKIDPSQFGAPSPCPEKAFGIGLNYQTHADESSMEVPSKPVVFAKFSSCICEPNATVELRGESVDYEGEIVVVIGKGGRDIASVHAWEHVFGVTVGQDISDRAVQMASNPRISTSANPSTRSAQSDQSLFLLMHCQTAMQFRSNALLTVKNVRMTHRSTSFSIFLFSLSTCLISPL